MASFKVRRRAERPTARRPLKLMGFRHSRRLAAELLPLLAQTEGVRVLGATLYRDADSKRPAVQLPFTLKFVVGETWAQPLFAIEVQRVGIAGEWTMGEMSPCCYTPYAVIRSSVPGTRLRTMSSDQWLADRHLSDLAPGCRECVSAPISEAFRGEALGASPFLRAGRFSFLLPDDTLAAGLFARLDALMPDALQAALAAPTIAATVEAFILHFYSYGQEAQPLRGGSEGNWHNLALNAHLGNVSVEGSLLSKLTALQAITGPGQAIYGKPGSGKVIYGKPGSGGAGGGPHP